MITINSDPEIDGAKTRAIFEEIMADEMAAWAKWPQDYNREEMERLKMAAQQIRDESECVVCIGIGGSYLGARAVIEAIGNQSGCEVIFAGNALSARALEEAVEQVGERDFSVIVISKSGETLEPLRAFEVFKQVLVEKYGEEGAAERIYAITGEAGRLHDEAVEKEYTRFVIPEGVGGRYSVLTAVGLLPVAVAGLSVDELLAGATEAITQLAFEEVEESTAAKYAWTRFVLCAQGYNTEVFATFEPATVWVNEWLKQLFAESEGKNQQGIWPASAVYTTDLHSLGQFMQEGRRDLWETIIDYPTDEDNAKAVQAVQKAHLAGGIPVFRIGVPTLDEKGLGELIYFFEVSCAISAKLFGVNPFDQPGVEAYKTELRGLLKQK